MHTVMVIGGGGAAAAVELPIGLVVFGVPAAVAALFWRRFSRRG